MSKVTALDSGLPAQRKLPFESANRTDTSLHEDRTVPLHESLKRRQGQLSTTQIPSFAKTHGSGEGGDKRDIIISGQLSTKSGRSREAQDIDTQLLLSRAAAKQTNRSGNVQNSASKMTIATSVQPATLVSSARVGSRNYRCDDCRTSKRKCEKIPDDPEGRCQHCLNSGKECNFELLNQLKSFSQTSASVKPAEVESAFDNDNYKESQSTRVLRSQSQALSESSRVRAKVPRTTKFVPGPKIHRGTKRRASHASIKSTKRTRRHSEGSTSPRPPKQAQTSDSGRTSYGTNQVRALKIKRQPERVLHSDASTMTADSGDLDPPVVLQRRFQKANTKAVKSKLTSDCPTYSELSEQVDVVQEHASANLANEAGPCHKGNTLYRNVQTDPDVSLPRPSDQKDCRVKSSISLAEFSQLSEDARNIQLDEFVKDAIMSDDFLALCKMLDERWQTQLVTSRI